MTDGGVARRDPPEPEPAEPEPAEPEPPAPEPPAPEPPAPETRGVAEIRAVRRAEEWQAFAELVREYVGSLPFALDFQDVDRELAHLEEEYGPPAGAAFLARLDPVPAFPTDEPPPANDALPPPSDPSPAVSDAPRIPGRAPEGERWVGCVGLRVLEPGVGELKRMYVRPPARGLGLGRALAEAAVEAARARALAVVRLDTVAAMRDAIGLYQRIGFAEIPPYRHNPLVDARFFELPLAGDGPVTRVAAHRARAGRTGMDPGGGEGVRG